MQILIIRTVILYVVVMVSVRIMGKRTIGELQASELVITLMISDVATLPMQEVGVPLLSGLLPIAILVFMEVFASTAMLKWPWFNRVVCGRPVVVIKSGKVDQKAMRKLRLTCEDLFEALRKNNIFDMTTVDYAIMETDGQLSVLQKAGSLPASADMVGSKDNAPQLGALIISDGSVDEHSAELIGWSGKRIDKAIESAGLSRSQVFIMVARSDGSHTIIEKEKK